MTIDFGMYYGGLSWLTDSQMGIRFRPASLANHASSKPNETVVATLTDSELPSDRSDKIPRSYVVQMEPGWFVFRDKYR
jgi:hypothetical protein